MPTLVHITAGNVAARIARTGIAPTRWRAIEGAHGRYDRFVWVFPVLPSYTLTHSWARELKRWGRTSLAAVACRIPDDEMVLARHYLETPHEMTAAAAVDAIRSVDDPRGYEIMVPRRIGPGEIRGIRALPKAVGWRYAPNFKGRKPWLCDCPVCLPRGEVNARRDRERVAKRMQDADTDRQRRQRSRAAASANKD